MGRRGRDGSSNWQQSRRKGCILKESPPSLRERLNLNEGKALANRYAKIDSFAVKYTHFLSQIFSSRRRRIFLCSGFLIRCKVLANSLRKEKEETSLLFPPTHFGGRRERSFNLDLLVVWVLCRGRPFLSSPRFCGLTAGPSKCTHHPPKKVIEKGLNRIWPSRPQTAKKLFLSTDSQTL